MIKKNKKATLHPRNRYQGKYDLSLLCELNPQLSQWLTTTPAGTTSVNFAEPEAVKALNQALLKQYYDINWQLPEGFLCPPVPGRADYLHFLADLLASDLQGTLPATADVLDIGCGANCIYPLIGAAEYGWRFTGSEINPQSLRSANSLIAANPGLQRLIRLRRQKNAGVIFGGIIQKNDFFHLTLCNPPFHRSAEESLQGSERKLKSLGIDEEKGLNFAGQHHELWCEGGERGFIGNMIRESQRFSSQVIWFSTLVSKQENIKPLSGLLRDAGVEDYRVIEMGQGQKQSRLLAWSYLSPEKRAKRLRHRPA